MKKTALFICFVLLVFSFVGTSDASKMDDELEEYFQYKFTDIKPDFWAYDTIHWGVNNGVAEGNTYHLFEPNHKVTESQFLTMLIRPFEFVAYDPFSNVKWYEPYYNIAIEKNYPITGKPDHILTRTDVAELLTAAFGYHYSGEQAIQFVLGNGIAKGKDPYKVTIDSYKGGENLTRAEAVQFILSAKVHGLESLAKRPIKNSDSSELPSLPSQSIESLFDQAQKAFQGTGYKVRYDPNSEKDLQLKQGFKIIAEYNKVDDDQSDFLGIFHTDQKENIKAALKFFSYFAQAYPPDLEQQVFKAMEEKEPIKYIYDGFDVWVSYTWHLEEKDIGIFVSKPFTFDD